MNNALLAITNSKGKPVALPDFGGALVCDTHAHLDMLESPALALARAAAVGVGYIVTLVNVLENPEVTFEGLDGWQAEARHILDAEGREDVAVPEVSIIVGIHPHDAAKYTDGAEQAIADWAQDPRVVGIGEVGLDYFYDHSPREVQRDVFARQLRLAHRLNLPVCIHLRDAHEDGLAILRGVGTPARGAILHCFNLEYETAAPFVDAGCYVSFAGPLTFKKAVEVREAATQLPANRVFPETDCPFMAPEPLRGHKNEPAYVVFTTEVLAQCLGITPHDCATLTTATARRFFKGE